MSKEMDDMFGGDDDDLVGTESTAAVVVESRGKSNGVLAFHSGTEEAMLLYVARTAEHGNPESVLAAVDKFCHERHWMMHLGDEKRPVLLEALRTQLRSHIDSQSNRAFTAVELGSYCGYSAVCIVSECLRNTSAEVAAAHLFCIESNAQCVAFTRRLVTLAGLDNHVTVIHAPAGEPQQWVSRLPQPVIDLLFIDHDKLSYLHDLQAIEQAQLLTSGSVVIADNVLCLNRPLTQYLEHVRDPNGLYARSRLVEGFLEYTTEEERLSSDMKDGMEISYFR